MAYQSHHCSATLPCSVCLTVFLHTCLALSVLLPFMLCAPCPFNAPFLFCVFQLLHTTSFYMPESLSTAQPSLLCSAFLFSLCIFCILYSQCFCMLSPCRVLCLIIIATLQLLWRLNPCVHHHWVLCRDSLASPAVETLRLLCHSRAHSLCCSSRLQQSSICQ
jgi:hypothetical protein